MSPRTATGMDARRRRRLIETAAAEFAAAGYERASLNAIIARNGLSKSSFYHYFRSKEHLFDTVVLELGTSLAERLRPPAPESLAGPRFWQHIEELMTRLAGLADDPPLIDLGRIIHLPDAPRRPAGALAIAEGLVADWLVRALRAGRASGQVRDGLPESLQAELILAVLRSMDRWFLHHADEVEELGAEGMLAAALAAIRRLVGT